MKWSGVGLWGVLVAWALGCSSGGGQAASGSTSTTTGTGGSQDAATATTGTGGATTTGSSSGGANGSGASGGTTSGSGGGGAAGPLPDGGREYHGVVNLVSPAGVAELEQYLADASDTEANVDLAGVTRLFYEYYPDEYDFIIFLLPYALPADTTTTFAAFDVVNRPIIPGTGLDREVHEANFGTLGRLKGVIGSQGDPQGGRPPFAHELLHYWANHLDNAAFGFGVDRDFDYGAHWGHAGVFGQLGGFDPDTLACTQPAGAVPPDCTPEDNGRTRYTMSAYGPNTNSFKGVDYAALELYLMGLIPVEEVPDPILVLDDPQYVELDPDADVAVVEAAGINEVSPSDIVERHGARAATPDEERHLTAAIVAVSDAPLDDATLDVFVEWCDALGNYVLDSRWGTSFEAKTGGRMALSTRIGRRRTPDDPSALPMLPDTCSVLAQDCGQPGVGCYDFDQPECLGSGDLPVGSDCVYLNDCEVGSACLDNLMGGFSCIAYCDPTGDVAERACSTLCPDSYVESYGVDDAGEIVLVGALCMDPGAAPL